MSRFFFLAFNGSSLAHGSSGCRSQSGPGQAAKSVNVPADIQARLHQSRYQGALWGLRVVDAGGGTVLISYRADPPFSYRLHSRCQNVLRGRVAESNRPLTTATTLRLYRRGSIDGAGVLHGDLILQASGDLTMGGRTNPDGTIAVSNYDHNEADSLGNAVLPPPAPNHLAGYIKLARRVAAAGVENAQQRSDR